MVAPDVELVYSGLIQQFAAGFWSTPKLYNTFDVKSENVSVMTIFIAVNAFHTGNHWSQSYQNVLQIFAMNKYSAER